MKCILDCLLNPMIVIDSLKMKVKGNQCFTEFWHSVTRCQYTSVLSLQIFKGRCVYRKADAGYLPIEINWHKVSKYSDNKINYFSEEKYIKLLKLPEILPLEPIKNVRAVIPALLEKFVRHDMPVLVNAFNIFIYKGFFILP